MNKYFGNHIIEPADVLIRNKSLFGIIDHFGVYVGDNRIIENHPDSGVRLVSWDQFFQGRNLNRVRKFLGSPQDRMNAVNHAHSYLGTPYHLMDFNCESFANMVQGMGKRSQQVGVFAGLVIAGLAIATISTLTKR